MIIIINNDLITIFFVVVVVVGFHTHTYTQLQVLRLVFGRLLGHELSRARAAVSLESCGRSAVRNQGAIRQVSRAPTTSIGARLLEWVGVGQRTTSTDER